LQPAAVGEQLLAVPADQRFECRLVSLTRECDKPVIWLRLQEVE
jgi:hypothetical protein